MLNSYEEPVYKTASSVEKLVISAYEEAAGLFVVGEVSYRGSEDEVVVQVTVRRPLPEGDELIDVERCQNCGKLYPTGTTDPIEGYEDRVAPGEICPAGQCTDSECAALTTPVRLRRSEVIARKVLAE